MSSATLAQLAYSGLEAAVERGHQESSDYLPYVDRLADDVTLRWSVPAGTPFSGDFRGKAAVAELLTVTRPGLLAGISLCGSPRYLEQGDRVVVIGAEDYVIRATGVAVRNNRFLARLRFRDEMITSIIEIRDFSQFVDACRSSAPDSDGSDSSDT